MDGNPLIEIRDLQVKRGTFRLEIPSFRVAPGEVVGLVGPNGAGKTTLLETLAGLRRPDAGTVRVFGLDPWEDPVAVRSRLGFMTDDMPLLDLRIGRLLWLLSGYYGTWDAGFAGSLLERFKLDPAQKARELSRGQGTRIRLVTAMAFRPQVLVLDEPATGLDVAGRRSLLESVLEVVRDPARSVIVSSHMLGDVQRIADRLLVLSGGTVVRDGRTDELVGEGRTLEEALEDWGAEG
ncbi:MAG: ABC transporter ATP-binding protein [Thermoanaerobaculaceae bacterium]|jgi:ABC-2 type transport system ATP-binding protein|nr:ABC transporter ATP-binding protein [Thermoanaerobaculaceae bacterium]